MNKEEILKEFNNEAKNHMAKYTWFLNHCSEEAKQFLELNYDDPKQGLKMIVYGIDSIPKCPICGKEVRFVGKPSKLFDKYCSNECKYKATNMVERHRQGCLRKYGVDNISKVDNIKKKKTKSLLEHYGRTSNFVKYGNDNISNRNDVKKKKIETMKKNNSFGKSKNEDYIYEMLKTKFDKVKRQYTDNRYCWHCDFYIPENDLFIEYQGTWTHGNHPFNESSENDILRYKQMISKNSEYYTNAANNWRYTDVKKREPAKKNNLNYLEFFSLKEFEEWFKS